MGRAGDVLLPTAPGFVLGAPQLAPLQVGEAGTHFFIVFSRDIYRETTKKHYLEHLEH